jgi:hypothetical protein
MLGSLTGQADARVGTWEVWHDEIVRWRRAQTTILAALTSCLLGAGIWHVAVTKPDVDSARAAAATTAGDPVAPSTLYATVDAAPVGKARPAGYLGLSLEYGALEAYTGANPAAPDPVFVHLLRNLAPGPGQPVVLRIGGNSTDATWWPIKGASRPRGARYALTPTWLAALRALAIAVPARLIMGVNLAAGSPRVAKAEAQAFMSGIGRRHLIALEVGNEPDVYGVFPWYTGRHGRLYALRGLQPARVHRPADPLAGDTPAPAAGRSGPGRAALAVRAADAGRGRPPPARPHHPSLRPPGLFAQSAFAGVSLGLEPAERPLQPGPDPGDRAVRGGRPRPRSPVPGR